MIKSLPLEENPREKACLKGIESLSNIELLALILRTGNKEESVIQLSSRLLNEIGGISKLKDVSYGTLISLKGIKKAKAIELLGAIELAKRMKEESVTTIVLNNPYDIYCHVKNELMFLKQEHFVLLCLDTKGHILKEKTVFIGSVNMSIVTPREVFKEAISVNSAQIVLIHNHPSGDARPSKEDIQITQHFLQLGKMMSIEIVDHLIIGWNQYYSFLSDHIYQE